MRKSPNTVVYLIVAVALYFSVVWGFDAVRVLTSPTYGLEDVWKSQFVFGVGRLFGLEPDSLVSLAIFFGVMKLAAAGVCALHVLDRVRAMIRGEADTEILEGGLIMVVAVSVVAVIPALWMQNTGVVNEQTVQLLLAGIAVALCVIERTDHVGEDVPAMTNRDMQTWQPTWYTPWRR